MAEAGKVKKAKAQLSARVEPFWLNPATIKGTVAIVGGVAILGFPAESLLVLRIVLGAALIVTGLGDLWFHLRGRKEGNRIRDIGEGLLTVGLGVLLLAYPAETLRVIMLIAGAYLAVRGVVVLVGAIRNRGSDTWGLDLARGLFFIVFAGFMLLLPEAVFSGFVVALAASAVVLGGVMLAYGIQHHDEDTLVDVDAGSVSQIVRDWMMLQDVGDARRDEIDDGLYFEPPDRANKLVAWWVMLLLSVTIATFGILQDSTAVVIGAMLIAPLMTPIIGTAAGAVRRTLAMYEITMAEHPMYQIPMLEFRGTPVGIDAARVVRTEVLPQINTGVAGKVPGTGMVGAGLVEAPIECFVQGINALAEALQ